MRPYSVEKEKFFIPNSLPCLYVPCPPPYCAKETQLDVDAEQESVIFISQMGEAGISPGFPYFMASFLTFVFPTRPAFFNALCIFLAGPCSLLCVINFIPVFMLVTIGQSTSCRCSDKLALPVRNILL